MPNWWWRALIGPCSHVTSHWCQIATPGVSPTLHYRVYSNWSLATYPFFSSSEIYAFSLNCHFRSTCLTTKAWLDVGNMHTATLLGSLLPTNHLLSRTSYPSCLLQQIDACAVLAETTNLDTNRKRK